MEQQILCENKSFKLFILFKNLINVWGGTSAKIMSKLILVQNIHFSKVCTIFCLFWKIKELIFVQYIY